eukprot:4430275-Amphidinium_carterae.1
MSSRRMFNMFHEGTRCQCGTAEDPVTCVALSGVRNVGTKKPDYRISVNSKGASVLQWPYARGLYLGAALKATVCYNPSIELIVGTLLKSVLGAQTQVRRVSSLRLAMSARSLRSDLSTAFNSGDGEADVPDAAADAELA